MNQHDSSGFSFCFRGFVAWWNHWANGPAWWVNAPAWRLGLRQGGFWSWWILYLSFSPLNFDFHQILRASLVSPVKANDLPKLRAAAVDEVVLKAARDRKNKKGSWTFTFYALPPECHSWDTKRAMKSRRQMKPKLENWNSKSEEMKIKARGSSEGK